MTLFVPPHVLHHAPPHHCARAMRRKIQELDLLPYLSAAFDPEDCTVFVDINVIRVHKGNIRMLVQICGQHHQRALIEVIVRIKTDDVLPARLFKRNI